MLAYLTIALPLLAALIAALLPSNRLRPWLLPATALPHFALVLPLATATNQAPATGALLGLDPLGRLILFVVSLLFAAASLYALGYLRYHATKGNRVFTVALLAFLGAMSLAALSQHLGLLWVAVEATTLVSAPLIYYNHNRFSIEATWKYLLLCSVGIALAMLGILFVAYAGLHGGGDQELLLSEMLANAPFYSKPWLRAGFIFLLVGFGTKMGLAPLHTWKPDAYGEAPGLVGGLLAGGLTSIAFLAILRSVQIMIAAGEQALVRETLLALGVLSLLFAAVFVIRQRDIKRMLAYSSVEHMGILVIGVAVGGLGTYGAMFHVLNNALTKGVLFMTAGNIHRYYGSKRMCETQGALSVLPYSAGLFLAGFLAVTGSPPFATFMSEFTILRGIFANGQLALSLFFLAMLAVIFIGMGSTVLPVTMGPPMEEYDAPTDYRETPLTIAGPLVLMAIVLLLGVYLPEPLRVMFREAAQLVEVAK